jgi:hypothetical protein
MNAQPLGDWTTQAEDSMAGAYTRPLFSST